MCKATKRQHLLNFDKYRDAKNNAAVYQAAKKAFYDHLIAAEIGHWVRMAPEVDNFWADVLWDGTERWLGFLFVLVYLY